MLNKYTHTHFLALPIYPSIYLSLSLSLSLSARALSHTQANKQTHMGVDQDPFFWKRFPQGFLFSFRRTVGFTDQQSAVSCQSKVKGQESVVVVVVAAAAGVAVVAAAAAVVVVVVAL